MSARRSKLAQHDALVDALALAVRIARIGDLLPVLERRALIVAPEFRARVERSPIGQRLGEALGLPVGGAARSGIARCGSGTPSPFPGSGWWRGRDSSAARSGPPPSRRNSRSAASCPSRTLCPARTRSARRLRRNPGTPACRRAFTPEQQVRHEHRHQPRQRLAVIDRHLLDIGIGRPQRIGRFHQRHAELAAEHGFDLFRRRIDDRLLGLRALRIDHRLADDAEPHALERTRRAGALAWPA